MTIKIRLEDEFYTEDEISAIFDIPIIRLVAMRGAIDWVPYSYVNEKFLYRKSVADYHHTGDETHLNRSAIFVDEVSPQIPIHTLGFAEIIMSADPEG